MACAARLTAVLALFQPSSSRSAPLMTGSAPLEGTFSEGRLPASQQSALFMTVQAPLDGTSPSGLPRKRSLYDSPSPARRDLQRGAPEGAPIKRRDERGYRERLKPAHCGIGLTACGMVVGSSPRWECIDITWDLESCAYNHNPPCMHTQTNTLFL